MIALAAALMLSGVGQEGLASAVHQQREASRAKIATNLIAEGHCDQARIFALREGSVPLVDVVDHLCGGSQATPPPQDGAAAAKAQIAAFAADPKHPYFGLVRQDIIAILQAKRATSLEDAYKIAVSENPTVRKIETNQIAPIPNR